MIQSSYQSGAEKMGLAAGIQGLPSSFKCGFKWLEIYVRPASAFGHALRHAQLDDFGSYLGARTNIRSGGVIGRGLGRGQLTPCQQAQLSQPACVLARGLSDSINCFSRLSLVAPVIIQVDPHPLHAILCRSTDNLYGGCLNYTPWLI